MSKTVLTFSPTFNPTAKTLDFSSKTDFDAKNLYAVINVTQNQMIYAVGQFGFRQTSIAGSVITLEFDTTTHNAADKLMIIYEDAAVIQKTQDDTISALATEVRTLNEMMYMVLNYLQRTAPYMDTQNRPNVVVSSGTVTTIATVNTVSAVTAVQGFGTGNASKLPWDISNMGVMQIYNNIISS